MKTIHKYVLDEIRNEVPTFEGAKIIHVANQYEHITAWAEVEPLERECMKVLYVVGTGREVPPGTKYVGTAQLQGGDFVFHVYEATQ